MAISRERKEELVAQYTELLSTSDGFIVTEYRGLSVAKLDDLRNALGESDGVYTITKNTLFRIALEQNNWPIPESLLEGPTAVAFGGSNLPGVAKIVRGFVKDNADLFIIKGGVMAGSVFAAKDVEAIADLPTMDEIRAQLAGLIVMPASQIAGLLQSATSQVVNVIQAYVDDRTPPGSDASEPASEEEAA